MFLAERDPLHDVMDWLVSADLGEDEPDKATVAPASGGPAVAGIPRRSSPSPTARAMVAKEATSPAPPPEPPAPPQFAPAPRTTSSYCGTVEADPGPQVEPEEAEWDARQQQTGAAGRMVTYDMGDNPTEDLVLRGACWRRKVVASVVTGGKAAQAGVKAGDVLVSINGKKDFQAQSADMIHDSLAGPITLVFMGFVGKLEAEVRLNYKQKVCGLSSQQQVVFGRPDAPVQVMDEVVFQPGSATLILATRTANNSRTPVLTPTVMSRSSHSQGTPLDEESEEEEDCIDIDTLTSQVTQALQNAKPEPQELSAVYELRGHEARKILSRALSRSAPRAMAGSGISGVNNGGGMTSTAGKGRMLHPPAGDLAHSLSAQTPRSLDPLPSAFSNRLDPKTPPEIRFGREDDKFMERKGAVCDIEGWFGVRCDAPG